MKRPNSVHAVIFDVGQTILYPDFPFFKELLRDFDLDTTIEQHREVAARGREQFFRGDDDDLWKEYFTFWLTEVGVAANHVPGLLKRIHERHHQFYLWNWVEPTAEQTFESLRSRGFRTAVVSNADGKIASVLEQLNLAQYFETIIDSKIVQVEKPDPAIFEIVLERLGEQPDNCVYVGDNYDRDVVGARRAGITPILIDPHNIVPEHDVLKIKMLSDLLALLPNSDVTN